MNKYSMGALVAAGLLMGGLTAGSASAADFGGNCCADLEERIAELEATTARKGNRKVSLTISGWVAEQVMWWDDGFESNVYVGGIGTTLASHFKITGQATISPGWTAGYVLHIEAFSNEPLAWNQNTPDAVFGGIGLLQSFWFVKSDHLGKVSVGKQSHASDNTAILVDGSGSLVPANWVLFDNAGFFLRTAGGGTVANGGGGDATWGDLGFCQQIGAGIGGDCNGVPGNVVRYDSPTYAGFSVSASWGEDDMWDVAARYAGEFSGFKVAAAAAYSENTDEGFVGAVPGGGRREVGYFQVGGYIQHVPTGLFVYGAWGQEDNHDVDVDPLGNGGNAAENYSDGDHWYVKAGLRERWTPLGHTVVYGEYAERNDMLNPLVTDQQDAGGAKMEQYGVGIVQEIDAAAMSMWLSYKHFEGEIDGGPALEDFDLVKFGALINF